MIILLSLIVYAATTTITWVVIRTLCRQNQLVHITKRSSHCLATPQGGGLSIGLVTLAALFYLIPHVGVDTVMLLASMLTALCIGVSDDFFRLSNRYKLVFLLLPVLMLFPLLPKQWLATLLDVPAIPVWISLCIFLLGGGWVLNLTNFMDGINGLLVSQMIFLLSVTLFFQSQLALQIWEVECITVVIVACIAFLPFNFPRARIFLGDTGSLFFGVLVLWLMTRFIHHPNGLWVFLIVFAMFWVDATVTLCRRVLSGYKIFDAHREHAYQHVANDYWQSHTKATLFIAAINGLWLLPAAIMVMRSEYPILGCLVSLIPVFIYVIMAQAGKTLSRQ